MANYDIVIVTALSALKLGIIIVITFLKYTTIYTKQSAQQNFYCLAHLGSLIAVTTIFFCQIVRSRLTTKPLGSLLGNITLRIP